MNWQECGRKNLPTVGTNVALQSGGRAWKQLGPPPGPGSNPGSRLYIYIYIYIYIYEKGLRQSLASSEKGRRKVDGHLTMWRRSILPPLSRWTSGLQGRAKVNMISALCTASTAYLPFYTRRQPSAAHLSNTAVPQLCVTFEHPWTDRRLGWEKLNSRNTLHWEGGGEERWFI